jgi:hypothetical protein
MAEKLEPMTVMGSAMTRMPIICARLARIHPATVRGAMSP